MGGRLVASKISKGKLYGAEKKDFWAQEANTLFATKSSSTDLKMNRANEYATPTHSARTTKAYSVSFPVWIVRSQLSNSSTSGQTRQVIKTSVIIVRDTQDRKPSSIAQPFRREVTKSSKLTSQTLNHFL